MKIYTKTGDSGSTMMLSGERVFKADPLIEAIGSLDELNTALGYLASLLSSEETEIIERIAQQQGNLLVLGTMLGISGHQELAEKYPTLNVEEINKLENDIDTWQKSLPELNNFILPGGKPVGAWAHHCRSICRRMERQIVRAGKDVTIDVLVIKYANRLSDWLFVLARKLNVGKELKWSKGKILH
jgi:cob(I)alamin adenosyltransferase